MDYSLSKITINKIFEEKQEEIPKEAVKAIIQNFDSIKIKLSDDLIKFLQNNGGIPPDGVLPVLMFEEIGIKSLELELVI